MDFSVKSFESNSDPLETALVVAMLESCGYDLAIIEWDDPVIALDDKENVVAVGNYSLGCIELATNNLDAAMAVCKHFGDRSITEVCCSNTDIYAHLDWIVKHPFAISSKMKDVRVKST